MNRWLFAFVPLLVACSSAHEYDRVPGLTVEGEYRPRVDSSAASDATGVLPPRGEACGNGVDDDDNGIVDDNCACRFGEGQPCFSGRDVNAGVGVCAFGIQHCIANANYPAWSECTGAILPSEEIVDGLDNDCDGEVDEVGGVPQPGDTCYHGTRATLGVGPCHAGTPAVTMDPDGSGYVRDPRRCEGETLPTIEVCDGIDNDCDGAPDNIVERCDGVDNDCDGVVDNGCPVAMNALTRFTPATGSGAYRGDRFSMLQLAEVVSEPCSPDEVAVERRDHTIACAPPPPLCPPGQQLDYDTMWQCVPCAIVVQFGYLYAGERVCTEMPMLTCLPGLVPTFVESSRAWECRPQCDNGEYDQSAIEGMQICIPC